ncbi:MAG: hypothetical protein HY072_06530 [Deltaproteobacteria bacterium]|nr:hypothetical protein [Deltaproteobacteria bacterium]
MNNSKWLIFLSLIFIPFLGVEANTDFMYRAQDGKNPYLFVFKDEDGGSKRSPGIYIFRDKGEPELIFRGDILKGGTIQGNLEEFPISKETRLYESVVILDEKILIFDLNSDASDTSTFLQIGSRELLLHDPFSGEVVILDSVRTLQDISIYSLNVFHESNYFLQPVLFSVKQHGSFGNGVTFLVLFKSSDNSKKLEIVRTEVLDYRFYNTSELKKLDPATSQSDLCIVSPLYLKFYGRPQAKEPHYVARWRQRLREYVDKRGWEIAHSIEFPFFEYLSGQVRMYQYPIMCLPDTCPSGMAQYYDPTGGRSGIYFNKQSAMSGALDADARPLSRGTFDFNPSRPTELLVAHIDSNDMVVGYIDGVLWVVKEKIELENNFRTFLPDELSVYGQSENGMIYIFVSRKWPDVSAYTDETKVFILKSDGRGAYSLWRSVDLTQSCFTRSNLKWRIRKMGTNGLLFDPHTPPQDSVIAYQQNADDTLPFIDILRTAESGSLHYTYIKALKETKVLPNLVYREYQPTKITENKTGFYLIIKGREYFLPGQFLTAPVSATFASRSTNGELLSVDDVSAKDNNKKIKIKGSLLAIDSAFHSGAESFSLTFALSAPEETSVVPSFVNTPILVPFDRFDGVRILQGKKVNAGDLFFLVFIKPPNAKTVSKNIVYPSGGVILVTIKGIELKQAASDSGDSLSIAFSSQQSTTLSNVYLSPSDLKDRIVPDSGKGGFYWKIDPSAKRTDPQCFYMDLFSGASVLFQSLSQGVQGAIRSEKTRDAKSNEGVEGDDDYALGYHGRYRADWRVYGSHDLLERMGIKVFDQPALLQTLKQFPRLTEMLDKLANPQSPNQFEVILVEEAVTRDALKANKRF